MSHDTVVHRIVRPAVRVLARTRVAPDHLTALRFATGLAAGAAFAQGAQGWVETGALLFLLSAFLDRADGELARQTRRFSQRGHRWDLVADCAAGVMAFTGLGLGATDGPLGPAAAALGLLAAFGVTTLFWQVNVQEAANLPGITVRSGRALADPDDAMFAVPVILWCLGPEAVLLSAGTITPMLALWKVLQVRRRRSPARGQAPLR